MVFGQINLLKSICVILRQCSCEIGTDPHVVGQGTAAEFIPKVTQRVSGGAQTFSLQSLT